MFVQSTSLSKRECLLDPFNAREIVSPNGALRFESAGHSQPINEIGDGSLSKLIACDDLLRLLQQWLGRGVALVPVGVSLRGDLALQFLALILAKLGQW